MHIVVLSNETRNRCALAYAYAYARAYVCAYVFMHLHMHLHVHLHLHLPHAYANAMRVHVNVHVHIHMQFLSTLLELLAGILVHSLRMALATNVVPEACWHRLEGRATVKDDPRLAALIARLQTVLREHS